MWKCVLLNGNLSVMEAPFCGEQNRSELWTSKRFSLGKVISCIRGLFNACYNFSLKLNIACLLH